MNMSIRSFLVTAALAVSIIGIGPSLKGQAAASSRMFVLPYLGSAPETGLQYGATVFRVRQTADTATRPSTAQLFASYTAKSQAMVFASMDRWSAGNAWHVTGRLEWNRYPLPFYGFGDRAPASAEEFYTPEAFIASALVQRRVRGPLYLLGGYSFQNSRVTRTAPDGTLGGGRVFGDAGGILSQLQAGALWDDRDDVFAPARGSFVQLTGSYSGARSGSDYDFRRLVADGRHYLPLGGSRVFAVQAVTELTGGDAPFDQLSLVGNSNYLRGYTRGRFRDRDLAAVQGEYRAPLWRRLGYAAFGGAGRIAPRPSALFGADVRTLPSYGAGLRWTLFSGSRSDIRVDYARAGAGQSGLYVALNEAF
ncbi:MAG: BamA/TamA family outer membrane protein [Gemmatimonadaceae bacterium]